MIPSLTFATLIWDLGNLQARKKHCDIKREANVHEVSEGTTGRQPQIEEKKGCLDDRMCPIYNNLLDECSLANAELSRLRYTFQVK